MIRAALYYRVSTADQELDHQRGPCRALVARNGWTCIPEHAVEEVGSGANRRAGWERIMTLARERKVQRVVAWSLDRVGRSLWMISDSVRELDALGVPLVTVQEPWLQSSDELTRGLLISVFGYVADFERRRLIARTAEGLATSRRNGKIGGRPRAFAGAALAAALDARLEGHSWGTIRTMLIKEHGKKLPKGTIQRAVQRLQDSVT